MNARIHTVGSTAPTLALTLIALGCGQTDSPEGNGITGPAEDTTPPTVAATSPADGATGVPVGSALAVTFSEEMSSSTIDGTSFTLDGMDGSVGYSGLTATLVPTTDLEYGTTYQATIGTTVTDLSGNAMSSSHSWSFTTEDAPLPPFSISFEAGRRWLYDVAWSRTVVGSGIGVETTEWNGISLLHAEAELQWQGRTAWRLLRYDLEDTPDEDPFGHEVLYVSFGPDGLSRWHSTTSGGEWRTVMSASSAAFGDNAFLMAGDPRGPTTTMSTSQVTVPAGSYSTLRAHVDYRVTGQYVPEDIFETRTEHYADGVGLVRASWDFDFDDNDPAAWDVFENGSIELTHVDTGPFPNVVTDAEPNDAPAPNAQSVPVGSIVAGRTAVSDAGVLVTGGAVHPNVNGEARVQDWYEVTTSFTRTLRIDLDFETRTNGAWNDLDLYVFRQESNGSVTLVGSGTEPEGQYEGATIPSLPAGTYYVTVQAWDTPTGSVDYWLSVR